MIDEDQLGCPRTLASVPPVVHGYRYVLLHMLELLFVPGILPFEACGDILFGMASGALCHHVYCDVFQLLGRPLRAPDGPFVYYHAHVLLDDGCHGCHRQY